MFSFKAKRSVNICVSDRVLLQDCGVIWVKDREQVVMVCQAASQTRFRALKHENGIAGCATIIVRVIACFQPLQDCQVGDGVLIFVFLLSLLKLLHIFVIQELTIRFLTVLQAEYFRHLLKPVT